MSQEQNPQSEQLSSSQNSPSVQKICKLGEVHREQDHPGGCCTTLKHPGGHANTPISRSEYPSIPL
jgi:hypothetical protein